MDKKQSGQALVIILLVLVVILTVGLALVSRTVGDIKLSSQTELSNRAFNAAEAGVEQVLGGGSAGQATIGTGNTTASYNVQSTTVGGSNAAFVLNKAVAKDDTQQVWLIGHKKDNTLGCTDTDGSPLYCFNSNLITFYWGNPGQSASQTTGSNITPALEISIIYKDGSGYKIAKGVYDPSSVRASTNNFLTGVDTSGGFVAPDNLQFKKAVDLSAAPFSISGIGSSTTLNAVRLRLLYNDVPQLLGAQPTNNTDTFPVQGKLISSLGTAGNITRKVQVFESYPYLPGVFDYVLFNGSGNSLSK
ncbi:MAG: hypothetical protein M1120_03915 [Patescibacteria group bacterium]|nr:hypothetical protein [Patescibacteria group bacterium]